MVISDTGCKKIRSRSKLRIENCVPIGYCYSIPNKVIVNFQDPNDGIQQLKVRRIRYFGIDANNLRYGHISSGHTALRVVTIKLRYLMFIIKKIKDALHIHALLAKI